METENEKQMKEPLNYQQIKDLYEALKGEITRLNMRIDELRKKCKKRNKTFRRRRKI